jgi:phosphoglycolate phosphatase
MILKHVIFDLDGTLIDSKNEIEETYKNIFKLYPPINGINYDLISYTATLEKNIEVLYKDNYDIRKKAKDLFSKLYDDSKFDKTLLYPNVKETLKLLKDQGIILHIATNKRLKPTLKYG